MSQHPVSNLFSFVLENHHTYFFVKLKTKGENLISDPSLYTRVCVCVYIEDDLKSFTVSLYLKEFKLLGLLFSTWQERVQEMIHFSPVSSRTVNF